MNKILVLGGAEEGGSQVQGHPRLLTRLCFKSKQMELGAVTQLEEDLPRIHEALSLVPKPS